MACNKSKLMTGSASWTGSQSRGGEAGGEIRNCFVRGGNFKWGLFSPLLGFGWNISKRIMLGYKIA